MSPISVTGWSGGAVNGDDVHTFFVTAGLVTLYATTPPPCHIVTPPLIPCPQIDDAPEVFNCSIIALKTDFKIIFQNYD